jgi:hypothetical protein
MQEAQTPRDPTLPAAGYRDFVERNEGHVRHVLSLGVATLFDSAAEYTLQIASALYSGGAPAAECFRRIDEVATYEVRYIAEGRKYTFDGVGPFVNRFLERFPAAHLVGRAGELVAAHRRCTFSNPPVPWEEVLLTPLCAVLTGEPVDTDPSDAATAGRVARYLGPIPRLCQAVGDRDATAFATALDEFLRDGWGPYIERCAKTALKAKPHEYFGKWSYLSAALCRIMGGVPELPAKALKYVPVELVPA